MKIVLYFTATWCTPCKKVRPIIEQLEKDMFESVSFHFIDVDENIKLITKYEIKSVPTFILLENGEESARITGAQTREQLEEFITQNKKGSH